ncbi:MAG: fused MFS/spermidine synthase [Gemmatimonadota bacterium]
MQRTILYIAFFLSGAAGLVYEVVWTRYLALFVGHSAEAQILVIGMFLGGLALGSVLVGRVSERIRRPLRAYALAEVVIAVMGLGFHFVFEGVTGAAYSVLFPSLSSAALVSSLEWVIASLLVFVPAVALGTTFPLMAAGVTRLSGGSPGRVIGSLYCLNSLGGAVFVLVAGFGLIPAIGLPGTLAVAVLLNLLAAGGAETARRMTPPVAFLADADTADDTGPAPLTDVDPSRNLRGLLLGTAALTAIASFGYQIGWIRMLSLVMGSATHAFEIMLSAFILGLAIGAFLIRRAADSSPRPLRTLGRIQWLMGALALATLPVYAASFGWIGNLLAVLPDTAAGYRGFNVARFAIAIAVMLPATTLAGMTLPLITSTMIRARSGERAIGLVYGVNTAGAIVGVMLAGLVGLPLLGLKGILVAGALLDMALGVMLLGWDADARRSTRAAGPGGLERYGPPVGAGALTVGVVALAMTGVHLDQAMLTSGVFRYGTVDPATLQVLYYADGRTATVGVHRTGTDGLVVLTSNGKPDASLTTRWISAVESGGDPQPIAQQDESTQMLMSLISLAYAPTARRAAVIGHGSGVSGHFLLTDPDLDSLVTIEIEPRIVDASMLFYPANRLVFDDDRSRIAIADARAFLAQGGQPYDIILSEPSNPWVSGVSSLFTVEFYRKVRDRLSPSGVFAQWIHLYEIDDRLVGSMVAAIHEVFPSYAAYLVGDGDMMIVAGTSNRLPSPDWSHLDGRTLLHETRHFPRLRPDHLEGLKLFERGDVAALFSRWTDPNSDYRPILDTRAERARFTDAFSQGFYGLAEDRFQIAAALGGWRRQPGRSVETPILGLAPLAARAHGLSARMRLSDPRYEVPRDARPAVRAALTGFARINSPPTGESDAAWARWVEAFVVTERVLHAGTAGFADRLFYLQVREQLAGGDVPPGVVAIVDFLEGLASWDFELAAGASDAVVADVMAGRGGATRGEAAGARLTDALDIATVLDGTVVSLLETGRPERARDILELLAPLTKRPPDDFRLALLAAHIDVAVGDGGTAAGR